MTTDTTHTPGPWIIEAPSDYAIRDKANGFLIARCPYNHSEGASDERRESTANARLIAAAPELLQALKDALYCLETVAKNEGFDIEVGVVPQARAAIAKATGRES